jgi:hypothetical protein
LATFGLSFVSFDLEIVLKLNLADHASPFACRGNGFNLSSIILCYLPWGLLSFISYTDTYHGDADESANALPHRSYQSTNRKSHPFAYCETQSIAHGSAFSFAHRSAFF